MNVKNWLIGGVAGGVTAFVVGFLFYGLLLADFFASHNNVAGSMRADDEMVWWALIVGHLIYGLLFSFIFTKWAAIKTFMTGLKGGAIVGVLMGLGYGMIMYATTNLGSMEAVMADAVISAIMGGLTGAVVGQVLGMVDKS
ncbi:MAG: hypothetical protein AAF502_03505 [Bacteroidota bacterium]